MSDIRIGYCGRVDGRKVFFDGIAFITEINGKTLVIDYDAIHYSRKSK